MEKKKPKSSSNKQETTTAAAKRGKANKKKGNRLELEIVNKLKEIGYDWPQAEQKAKQRMTKKLTFLTREATSQPIYRQSTPKLHPTTSK